MRTGKRLLIRKTGQISSTVFFLTLLVLNVGDTLSEEAPRGGGYGTLLRLYGPPLEKQEYEVRRREIWLYNGQKVYLEHGKVVYVSGRQVSGPKIDSPEAAPEPEVKSETKNTSVTRAAREEVVVSDLLSAVQAAGEPDDGSDSESNGKRPANSRFPVRR